MRVLVLSLLTLFMCGCGEKTGLDRILDFTNKMTFQSTLMQAISELKKEDAELVFAFMENYRMTPEITDDPVIKANKDKLSLRRILDSHIKDAIDNVQKTLDNAGKLSEIEANLKNVTAANVTLAFKRDFSSDINPIITADITNGSQYGISSLEWTAELYLDDNPSPILTTKLFDSYNERKLSEQGSGFSPSGLSPGAIKTGRVFYTLGNEGKWLTIDIQNAKKRTLKLSVIPGSIKDFSDKPVLKNITNTNKANHDLNILKKFSA